eukprot:GHVQ01023280.1.p1 GENE.GHVQ01023280.1~~GHVQ01023280.1.p1  ORF type:complete len:127 (-),score=9.36 GHVQ01023280.1:93-473(-)
MLRWLTVSTNEVSKEPEAYESVVTGLQRLYRKNLLPLEKDFKFHYFYSPLLTDGDFAAKPMVMLIGQYSTGKVLLNNGLCMFVLGVMTNYRCCGMFPRPPLSNICSKGSILVFELVQNRQLTDLLQ